MSFGAALAALLIGANPQPSAPLAGVYATNQMEMAGALELKADGHFRYQFDYGAASEVAQGDWALDGNIVRLTSNPMPRQPAFSLLKDDPAPAGELYVAVGGGDVTWTPITAIVALEGMDRPVAIYAEDDGQVILPPGKRATSVRLLMPVYEAADDPVVLSADRGHRLLFRLDMNDAGQAPFRGEPLTIEGKTLVMHRYDANIIFRRAKP